MHKGKGAVKNIQEQTKDNEITGEREIIQPSGCRILYSLQLKKQ